jgi:sulfate transport system permease protein
VGSNSAATAPADGGLSRPLRAPRWLRGLGVGGIAGGYLGIIVLLPLAALLAQVQTGGFGGFWDAVSNPASVAALKLTVGAALLATVVNAVMGTLLAWVLVRDRFPGIGLIDAIVDLPFALPTIVAGLTIIALYGPQSPLGVNVAYTRTAILLALLFVTLPFVVRAVQPVLEALEPEVEEAAATLGASRAQTFWRITLPAIRWGLVYGVVLTVARALGEFGALIVVSGGVSGESQTLTLLVHARYIDDHNVFGAYAASSVLMAFALVTLLLMTTLDRRRNLA